MKDPTKLRETLALCDKLQSNYRAQAESLDRLKAALKAEARKRAPEDAACRREYMALITEERDELVAKHGIKLVNGWAGQWSHTKHPAAAQRCEAIERELRTLREYDKEEERAAQQG